MQAGVGLHVADVMPIYMIMPRYSHNYALSINCSVIICSPTVIYAILREATSDTYGPRVSFLLYCISFIYIASCLLFCNLYFPIYTTKIPKIFTLLSLLDLTFASDREGIDTPLSRWLQGSYLFVQVRGISV